MCSVARWSYVALAADASVFWGLGFAQETFHADRLYIYVKLTHEKKTMYDKAAYLLAAERYLFQFFF